MFTEKILCAYKTNFTTAKESGEMISDAECHEHARQWTVDDIAIEVEKYIDRNFWSFLEKKLMISIDNAD